MKNKGFTLVELLAVIVILAVLVIIALPNVMGMFRSAKKNSFETEVKNIYKTAQQTWMSESMFNTEEKVYSRCDGCTGKELDLSGRKELKYYIKVNKSGQVVEFYATDGTFQFSHNGDLLLTNIQGIEEISNLEENEIITISDSGINKPNEGNDNNNVPHELINTCRIDAMVSVDSENYHYSDQTLQEAYPNNLPIVMYYSPKATDDNTAFDSCVSSLTNSSSYSTIKNCFAKAASFNYCVEKAKMYLRCDASGRNCTYSDSYEGAMDGCTHNTNLYKRVNPTDLILPEEEGCYSSQIHIMVCLDGDSEIEVYDKKKKKKLKKKLKDITYDDYILCWDFEKGEYKYEKPLWIMNPTKTKGYTELTFSDGSILKVMGDHRIYNADSNKFTSCKNENDTPIGMKTVNSKGEMITLVDRKAFDTETTAYNVIINKYINLYANGILTSRGLNNLYPIKDMKFIKEDREVFTREELSEIPDEYFYGLNLGETPRTFMGSEEKTKEQLLSFIERTINTKKK